MGSSRSSFYCSSSSASPPQIKFDVFLSFRPVDMSFTFISHLHQALNDGGINSFVYWTLNRGDGIYPSLIRAIEESRISIIIFSENYASSGWCLEELTKIIECKNRETNKQCVIPVFYKIMPSDVRKQTGSFADAFAMHEQRFKENLERVHRWRDALREAANLSAWFICGNESEAEFVDNIIRNVLAMLKFVLSNDDGNCFNCNGRFRRRIMSWERGELLGTGSVGAVYEGITNDGAFIAVKEVSLMDQSTQGKQSVLQLKQEISLLSEFEHENIVRYFGALKVENKLYIFLELVTKGSLEKLYGKYALNDSQVSAYTRQILNGLKYLHDRNVVHRDIKCANILVDASGSVKLADFGLAKAIDTNYVKSCKGTPFWMAPEVVNPKNHGYGLAADIWSLGCTVLEMLTRRHPYYGLESMQALFQIGQGNPPPLPDDLSRDAEDFILKCIQVNPNDRPTAAQLLDHPFIKEHCILLENYR